MTDIIERLRIESRREPHEPIWRDAIDEIEALAKENELLRKDAERYRWLRDRAIGIDFDWSGDGITALCFEMPDGVAYGGNCDRNIDAAMSKDGKQ